MLPVAFCQACADGLVCTDPGLWNGGKGGSSDCHPNSRLQVNQQLELDSKGGVDTKYAAMDKWAKHVQALHTTIVAKLQ